MVIWCQIAVSVMQCVEKFLPNFARPYRKLNVFKLPSNIISIKLPLQLREVIAIFVSEVFILSCPIFEIDNFIEN